MNRYEMQKEIELKTRELTHAKQRLEEADRQCGHEWGPTVDASIYHEGYTAQGDPVGTMGIDWRGPISVPSRTEIRFKRCCKKCGKEEFTTKTQKSVTERPVW